MKNIDSKFHLDGEQIVKTSNGEVVPEDEPVFVLRARDRLALPLLKIYHELCTVDGCNDYQMTGIQSCITRFEHFRLKHNERMKQPGITRGL